MRAGRRPKRQPLSGQSRRPPPLTWGRSLSYTHTHTHTTGHFNSSSEQTAPYASSTASPSGSGIGPRLSSRPSFLTRSQFPHPTDREAGGSSPVPGPPPGGAPAAAAVVAPLSAPDPGPGPGLQRWLPGTRRRGSLDSARHRAARRRSPSSSRRWWRRRQLQERPPRRLMTHGRGVGGGWGVSCLARGDAGE